MDYETFIDTIVGKLENFYGKDADVRVREMPLNNGVSRRGLLITFTGCKETVCPVIYLDNIYESYSDGGRTMDECVGMVASMRKEFAADGSVNGIADKLLRWEDVKDSVYPALVSMSENRELLKILAYTPFLDLAVIYIIRKEFDGSGNASVKITNTMLDTYGIRKSDLHKQAMENLEKDGYEMEDIIQMLHKTVSMNPDPNPEKTDTSGLESGKLYVLTNGRKFYGAAGLLSSRLLEKNLGGTTCFILPSSIHEAIFVPVSDRMDAGGLNTIIHEVNQTQVDVSERLSDHCYIYDGTSKSVKMCA